ncbi:MAG: hypothetical protein V3V99_11765 [candidate division Zixibacteria bacterium]
MEDDRKFDDLNREEFPESSNEPEIPTSLIDQIFGRKLTRRGEFNYSGNMNWHKDALEERRSAGNDILKALSHASTTMAKARRSSVVTDADVRDALRRLVLGLNQTPLVRLCRLISIAAVFWGGTLTAQGFQTGDYNLIAIGTGFGIALIGFEELLLHFRR